MANDPYADIASPVDLSYDAVSVVEKPHGDGYDAVSVVEARPAAQAEQSPYTFANLKRGLGVVADRYLPTALKVHEANGPSPFLDRLMPHIDAPDASIPIPGSPINFNPSIAVAPINALATVAKGLSNPEMAPIVSGMGAVSAAGRLVPAAQKLANVAEIPLQAYFGADMLHGAAQGAVKTGEQLADPSVPLGTALETGLETTANAALGAGALLGAKRGAATAIAEAKALPPAQATQRLREQAAVTADADTAKSLENLAKDIEKQAADQVKAANELAKAQEQQAKAAQNAAQTAAEQQQAALASPAPPEVPKSTQIIEEVNAPKSLANAAAIGAKNAEGNLTQLQSQINEVAVSPKLAEPVAADPQLAAPTEVAPAKVPSLQDDIATYEANAKKFNALIKAGDITSPEFQQAFALNEEIKNRHGGMVPTTPAPKTSDSALVTSLKQMGIKFDESNKMLPPEDTPANREFRESLRGLDTQVEQRHAELTDIATGQEMLQNMEAQQRVASKELRLNNADLDLKPLSLLSRAEKRAELDAAGVTTYKGKSLDEANPAEISAAVGKLRRGELNAEGEVQRTSDKIIEHLQNAKIRKPGQLSAAAEPFSIAYDAAIDTAIVAIRAGRALAEVVALAIDRFRKLHPKATEEQVARLAQDVEVAHGYGDPTPGRTEAEGIIKESAPITPVAGRSPEVTQKAAAMRRGLISGGDIEKWADTTLANIRKQGRQYSGFDVEYGAAATVKLLADLERGAVDFARWSADQIKEFGEAARPHLQSIWDGAQKQFRTPPDYPVYSRDNLGPNSAKGYDRDIINVTDRQRTDYAKQLGDWAEKTQDWQAAHEQLSRIPDESRAIAAAELALRAEKITDPEVRDAYVRQFTTEAYNTTSQAGQALQSAKKANEILTPLTGYSAWLGVVRRRLAQVVESKVGEGAGDKVRKGINDAGNEAGNIIADAANGARLDRHNALVAPLRRIATQLGVDWKAIFTDLPEVQAARKAEIFSRLTNDPKLSGLDAATKQKLSDAAERAWESIRNDVFRQEFGRLVELPGIDKATEAKVKDTIPQLIRKANLGLLDNEAFLSAVGERYGITGLDSTTAGKLRELGEKAMRTPRGSERNRVFQEIEDTILHTRGIDFPALLRDVWYRNVMSAPRTAFEIGAGGVVQGAFRSAETVLDTLIRHRRPDLAFKMIGQFFKDASIGTVLGADLIATGDRTSLPRYEKRFLDSMDALEQGKAPGGEVESLYRRGGLKEKIAFGPFEYVGRILTALDYIGGQGVRQQQMLYAALTRGDGASLEAAMRRFNKDETVQAAKQARAELPDARPAERLARQREILNEGISQDIQEFGNLMTEVTALNAPPVGIGGQIYKGMNSIPFFDIAKFPAGAAFLKAGINLFQRYTDFQPGTGQINFLRTKIDPNSRFGKIASLKDLPIERQRQQIAAQYVGLAALGAATAYFIGNKNKDVEISGSWFGLTPEQKRQLRTAGEAPLSVKAPWTGGKWVSYRLFPVLPVFATVGHWRDQERFNGKKWDDKSKSTKVVNAWLAGLAAVKDLSVASSMSGLVEGLAGTDQSAPDADKALKAVANSLGNAATGLIPMNSLLRELDQYEDQQRYVPGKDNPGVDLYLRQIPFVRRQANTNEKGDPRPALDFFGHPVKVLITPFNRHVAPPSPRGDAYQAMSEKIGQGVIVPVPYPLDKIVNAKGEQVAPTSDEQYFYQRSVRNGIEQQVLADLPAFMAANPEQASNYLQKVTDDQSRYVLDRMQTQPGFDGKTRANPKLSSALTQDYQTVTDLNNKEAGPATLENSKVRVAYDEISALPPEGKRAALVKLFHADPVTGQKVIKMLMSKTVNRDALQQAESTLSAPTRGTYYRGELDKLKTPEEKRAFLTREYQSGNLSTDVLKALVVAP